MKKVIGNKKVIIGLAIIVVAIVAICLRLTWKYEYFDEASVLKYYYERFSEPEKLCVHELDKYIVSDEQTYYYIKVSYPPESETERYELLLILNHANRAIKMVNFNDLADGYYDEVKEIWDEIKQKGPDVSFYQEIIDEILEVVLTK